MGYPVLQTADIILYKADTVPVGKDQVPHLELAREIVRRFNNHYGKTFPEPQAKLTEDPLILGLDGQNKMSKSLDNHLELAASPEETAKRVATAFTDPQRLRRPAQGIQSGQRRAHDIRRVHHRRTRLRGLQAPLGGQQQQLPGAISAAPAGIRGPSRLRPRGAGGWSQEGPGYRPENHRGSLRKDGVGVAVSYQLKVYNLLGVTPPWDAPFP